MEIQSGERTETLLGGEAASSGVRRDPVVVAVPDLDRVEKRRPFGTEALDRVTPCRVREDRERVVLLRIVQELLRGAGRAEERQVDAPGRNVDEAGGVLVLHARHEQELVRAR